MKEIGKIKEPKQNRVQAGDLWQLGTHRLLCGDCTEAVSVARLMQGERATLTITSPPYNAGVQRHTREPGYERLGKYLYAPDALSQAQYLRLLTQSTQNALSVSDILVLNLQMLAGNKQAFLEYLYHFREQLIDILVWDKQNARPARSANVLNSRFEFLLLLTRRKSHGRTTRNIFTARFHGTVDNVYTAPPQRHNPYFRVHAATFPLHLPRWLMETFGPQPGIVYDPFLGTGTTLMAAEQAGRRCFGIEIEPVYCEIVLQRWEEATARGVERLSRRAGH